MPPMHAGELHQVARQGLGPTLAGLRFKRTPSTSAASWARPEGNRWLVMWIQPYRSGGGPRSSRFTLELRLSTRPETGGDGFRKRLPALLTEAERREIRNLTVGSSEDVWFQHRDEADAHVVMAFLAGVLPAVIDRFRDAAREADEARLGP